MESNQHFDIVIIGAGSAGIEASRVATANNKSVALVEAGYIGGTCYNSGCLPTKYMLGATEVSPLFAAQKQLGSVSGNLNLSLEAIQHNKAAFLAKFRDNLESSLTNEGVTIIKGKASFLSPTTISVKTGAQEKSVSFERCIIATGSTPAAFPTIKADGARVIGSSSAINLKTPPRTLLLVGGGPIGLELGEFYHRLGTQIIVVDRAPRLLAMEDPEISEALADFLQRQGWQICLGQDITSVATVGEQAELRCESGKTFQADYALVAIGRRPNLIGLQHENAAISLTQRGFICTNDFLQASSTVYAAGDITGRLLLGNAAADQAQYAARHICGLTDTPYSPPFMPSCVYGSVEVMRVGKTMCELEKFPGKITSIRTPLSVNPMALSTGDAFGFIKLLFVDDILMSVYAIGHGVSQLTSFAASLIESKISNMSLTTPLFAFPSLAEIIKFSIDNQLKKQ